MKKPITPCLWFDDHAEEAAGLYTSLFKNSGIINVSRYGKEGFEVHGKKEGTALTVEFNLGGQLFNGLNGGPQFKFNPSISFYAVCESEVEVDFLWEKLSENGSVMMPLDQYPWSGKFGWLNDRYGLSWQISLDKLQGTQNKISPSFLFMGSQHSLSEQAVNFYTSVFPGSNIQHIVRYGADEGEVEGSVKHAQFTLQNQIFMLMGNSKPQQFDFNEAISFQVFCDSQEEIDFFWDKLSEGGSEGRCGWLKDKYGVSWQVVPSNLGELMGNPEKSGKVMEAFLKMNKFDLNTLMNI